MKEYLQTRINEGKVVSMPCTGCGTEISEKNIKRLLPASDFTKYQQFQFLAQLRLEPDCRWCPKRNCGNGLIVDRTHPDFPKVNCDVCHTDFCFHCSLKWHKGISCKKWQKKVAQRQSGYNKRAIKKNKKWMKENKLIKCKKCGQGVQKSDGCNHMTCTCGFEFCWLCGDTILSVDLHYIAGACAGLQFSKRERVGAVRSTARVGLLAGMVVGGSVVALGLAVPVVAAGVVAVPIYGGYRLHKYGKEAMVEKHERDHYNDWKKVQESKEWKELQVSISHISV
jgi:hypothetical protein